MAPAWLGFISWRMKWLNPFLLFASKFSLHLCPSLLGFVKPRLRRLADPHIFSKQYSPHHASVRSLQKAMCGGPTGDGVVCPLGGCRISEIHGQAWARQGGWFKIYLHFLAVWLWTLKFKVPHLQLQGWLMSATSCSLNCEYWQRMCMVNNVLLGTVPGTFLEHKCSGY